MKTRILTTLFMILCLMSPSSGSVKAQDNEYTIIDLGTLTGGFQSEASYVNELGEVAGWSSDASGMNHAFLWTKQAGMQDLGTLGGDFSYPHDINNLGQVVGWSFPPSPSRDHAFLWTSEEGMRDLGTLDGWQSEANAINENGQVVGSSRTAFLWSPENGIQNLGTLGGAYSEALDINELGKIVGYSYVPSTPLTTHAFLWTAEGGMQDLGTLGEQGSTALKINDNSQVMGYLSNGHVFIWTEQDGMQDLGTLGGSSLTPIDINEKGQVVGWGYTSSGEMHAFLWTTEGGMQDLGTLNGEGDSQAKSINDLGQLVGYSHTTSGETHAFLWTTDKGMQDLGTLPGGNFSEAREINNYGQIVGASTDTSGATHAVMWLNPQINLPPIADAGGPYTAYKGETITLDASNSYDPEGGQLTYEWDLNNDGQYDDATGIRTGTSFVNSGNYTVGLRVTDTGDLSDTVIANVTINNPPLKWKSRPDMPTARYNMGAVVSGGKVYVIGGDNYSCTPLTNVEEYDPITNSWSIRASMPTGRWGLGVATGPNSKIYAMGGMGGGCGSDMLTTVEAYDPATNSWETRADMPTQRISFSVAAATNGKIYVFGGEDYNGWLATVEEYDPTTNSWTQKANMPYQNKAFSSTTAANGKIYIVGGDADTDKLWEYDPEQDSWVQRASIPVIRYGVKIAQASDGRIYAIGGVAPGDGFQSVVESYDPLTDTWRSETGIKTPRSGHVVAAVDQYIFAIGGGGLNPNGDFTPLNSVEAASVTGVEVNFPPVANAGGPYTNHDSATITLDGSKSIDYDGDPLTYAWDLDNDGQYDDATGITTDMTFTGYGNFTVGLRVTDIGGLSDTDTAGIINNPTLKWKSLANMPTPRWSMGAAVSGNKIYVIGGDNWSCVPLTNVEEYDPTTNVWRVRAPMPTGRWVFDVATGPDGKIYAIGGGGGDCGSTILDTVEAYDPATNSWETKASMHTPRVGHGVATATNGKIYVFGGENFNGWLATVEEYDPATNIWTQKADMPYANTLFSITAASNGKIYIMDGQASGEDVWEYDPSTDTWSLITKMQTRFRTTITQTSNGQIYVIGGELGGVLGTVEAYSIANNSWSAETTITTPRIAHDVVALGDYVYVLGGWNDGPVASVEAASVTGVEVNFPPVADAGGPYTANEGDTITLDASLSNDPEEAPLTYAWDFDNNGQYNDATGVTAQYTATDDGIYTIGLRVTDRDGLSSTNTAAITVYNVAPTVGSITAPIIPIKVNTTINSSFTFTDPGMLDTHVAYWYWGDGNSSAGVVTESNGSGSVTGSHTYTIPGVYTIYVELADDDWYYGVNWFEYVVVYDPTGSFVTGSGWINSPEGAYTPDPTLIGKATFGFVSKYQKGTNVPTGVTEFQFNVANFYFESTSYDWLVIAGMKAQFKGTGTINGEGEYKFILTAIDGSPDMFRIKIWNKETGVTIYDNQLGASDNSNDATELGGGSIVIHKPK